jgi:hypothetical protein
MSKMKKKIIIIAVALGTLVIGAAAIAAAQLDYHQLFARLGREDAEHFRRNTGKNAEKYLAHSENLYVTQDEVDILMKRGEMFDMRTDEAVIVKNILRRKALYYYATSIGIGPTDEEVRAYIEWNRNIISTSSNRDDILAYIEGTGMTEDKYWDSQHDQLRREKALLKLEEYFQDTYYDGEEITRNEVGMALGHHPEFSEAFLEWADEIYAQVLEDEGIDLVVIEDRLR